MIFMSLWQTSAGSTISTGADDAGLSNLRALAAELSTAAPTYAGTAGGVMGGPSTCSTSGWLAAGLLSCAPAEGTTGRMAGLPQT